MNLKNINYFHWGAMVLMAVIIGAFSKFDGTRDWMTGFLVYFVVGTSLLKSYLVKKWRKNEP